MNSSSHPQPVLALKCAIGTLAALCVASCSVSESKATEAAEAYGFSDVKLGGISAFGCSDKDTFTRVFTATGPTGHRVKGVVCKGVFKGATVRITGKAQ